MVRECAVRLQKLAARRVRAQRLEHFRRVKAARAVARVHHNVEPRKRLLVALRVDPFADHLAQPRGIGRHVVDILHAARPLRRRLVFLRKKQDLFDVRALKAPFARKEFQAVAVKRVVACRNLHRARAVQVHRRHEHARRRGEVAAQHAHAARNERIDNRLLDAFGRNARIVADRNAEFRGLLARLLREPQHEARGHARDHLVGQIDRGPIRRARACDPADIRAAFEMAPIGIEQWDSSSCRAVFHIHGFHFCPFY